MKRLGVSIYPNMDSKENIINYLTLASKYKVTRVFTNLLKVSSSKEDVKNLFYDINTHAKQLGMEVIIDVAPSCFEELDITYDDLSFFKEINADGIRLDEGFDGAIEAKMTRNPYGLKIEINASMDTAYVDQILAFDANKSKLITCHNFYPQRYTGLGFDYFKKCSLKYQDLGLNVAAFVFSNNKDAFGCWPEYDGLPTLEAHRDFSMDLQIRHLSATKLIDDIIISNCYPKQEEFEMINDIDFSKLCLKLDLNPNNTDLENEIIFEYDHIVRGDMSEYMARSTMPRITYADSSISAHDTNSQLKVGDVVILNDDFGRYKGELHIILKEMPNDGKKNVVGKLSVNEDILIPYLTPWKAFKFIK